MPHSVHVYMNVNMLVKHASKNMRVKNACKHARKTCSEKVLSYKVSYK